MLKAVFVFQHKFSHLIMVGVFKVSITMQAKGAKHYLKAERDTEAWEAQCPFVCTHKRQIFVWVHKTADLCSSTKMQMSKALSEALHIQDSVKRQQVAATEGG